MAVCAPNRAGARTCSCSRPGSPRDHRRSSSAPSQKIGSRSPRASRPVSRCSVGRPPPMATRNSYGNRWIILRSLVAEAGSALRARRLQAALSAFGIATGIAAVVILVALVSGLHRMALQTFNTRGANVVLVNVAQDPSAAAPDAGPLTLTPDDAEAILRASPYFDLSAAENNASAVVRGVVSAGRDFMMIQ